MTTHATRDDASRVVLRLAPIARTTSLPAANPTGGKAQSMVDVRAALLSKSVPLAARSWSGRNHTMLQGFLRDVAARTDGAPKTAVFDWDNTSIFGDIGFATARQQLHELDFKLTAHELATLIPDTIAGHATLADGLVLKDARADILDAYAALQPFIARDDLAGARETPAYADFGARMASLYTSMEETPGIGAAVAYPWLVRWLGGHTPSSIGALARRAADTTSAERCGRAELATSSPGRSGHQSFCYEKGLAPQAELKDLMARLRDAGVQVHIVTASQTDVVRAAAQHLGYPLEAENIHGMELAVRDDDDAGREPIYAADGRSTDEYPTTNGIGKVELIDKLLPAPPLLVGGDSDGDFPMLTAYPTTEVRLVFHRNRDARAQIFDLYEKAEREDVGATPAGNRVFTLLQGRDELHGVLQPSSLTTPRL